MLKNLEQRQTKIKLVWNHFDPKFIVNNNIYSISFYRMEMKSNLYCMIVLNHFKFIVSNLRFCQATYGLTYDSKNDRSLLVA